MPKLYTFPTLFDEALQISISRLKEWNYLNREQIKNGKLTWSRNGNKTASISIKVNTQSENPYIELDYKYNDEPRIYKVQLVSIPSNLRNGVIWYFLCPQTNKRCRILYSIGGYFFHRKAFTGCMYESQTKSKYYRELDKTFGAYYKTDQLYEQVYSKHFKRMYVVKPTKRFLLLMKQIRRSEQINPNELIEFLKR